LRPGKGIPLVKWFFQVVSESGGGWFVTAMPMLLTRVITRNSPMPMLSMISVGCVKARARTRGGSVSAAATISCTASMSSGSWLQPTARRSTVLSSSGT
jgi:hypothetical protein